MLITEHYLLSLKEGAAPSLRMCSGIASRESDAILSSRSTFLSLGSWGSGRRLLDYCVARNVPGACGAGEAGEAARRSGGQAVRRSGGQAARRPGGQVSRCAGELVSW